MVVASKIIFERKICMSQEAKADFGDMAMLEFNGSMNPCIMKKFLKNQVFFSV